MKSSDFASVTAVQRSSIEFYEKFKETPYWLPRQFGGMPSYLTSAVPDGSLPEILYAYFFRKVLPYPYGTLILLMLGMFFLLYVVWDVRPWVAAACAIASGFATYNLLLIEAGHLTKIIALSWVPWILFGFFLILRKKQYYLGIFILSLATAFQIMTNHYQIIYYTLILLTILWIVETFRLLKQQSFSQWMLFTALLAFGGLLGTLLLVHKLYATWEFAKVSNRGPSEIQEEGAQQSTISGGLTKKDAYGWSYSRAELLNLWIPNASGGASYMELDKRSFFYQWLIRHGVPASQALSQVKSAPTYWGGQPFTGGPAYIGAVLLFLFFLGLLLPVDPYVKYGILYVSLIYLLLALGKYSIDLSAALVILSLPILYLFLNKRFRRPEYFGIALFFVGVLIFINSGSSYTFMDLFFDYIPLFNKFRAPSTILSMLSVVLPILAALGVENFFQLSKEQALRLLYTLAVLVGGVLLLLYLLPEAFFDFSSPMDERFRQWIPAELYESFRESLIKDRIQLFKKDVLRTFFFSLLTFALLWFYKKQQRLKQWQVGLALSVLMAADLLGVDWRFLNKEDYTTPRQYETQFNPLPYEQWLLQNDTSYYRILPLAIGDPFSDGHTAYYFHTVAGYSPVYIKRYRQMINRYIGDKFYPQILNILNCKYIITSKPMPMPQWQLIHQISQGGKQYFIYLNKANLGPAWIVEAPLVVPNADAAIDTLVKVPLDKYAIIEEKDAASVKGVKAIPRDSAEYVKLLYHDDIRLRYEYYSPYKRIVVFSENFYPEGWHFTIDGRPAKLFRADFTLRAAVIPPGKHVLKMHFYPDKVYRFLRVAQAASVLVLFLFLWILWRWRKGYADAHK